MGSLLGEGEFGKVVKAEALNIREDEDMTTVAVKMLKGKAEKKHHVDIFNILNKCRFIIVILPRSARIYSPDSKVRQLVDESP